MVNEALSLAPCSEMKRIDPIWHGFRVMHVWVGGGICAISGWTHLLFQEYH